jgi:SNF2 family DNA or RNA helicase
MLNYRKLKQEFSPQVIKEAQMLADKDAVQHVSILDFDKELIKVQASVQTGLQSPHTINVEIDRVHSEIIDSVCDNSSTFSSHQKAICESALVVYLEKNLDKIIAGSDATKMLSGHVSEIKRVEMQQTLEQAKDAANEKLSQQVEQEVLFEYITGSRVLSSSSFFVEYKYPVLENVELVLVYNISEKCVKEKTALINLGIRISGRNKVLPVADVVDFVEKIRFKEPQVLSNREVLITTDSFNDASKRLLQILMPHVTTSVKGESQKNIVISYKVFADILKDLYVHIGKQTAPKYDDEPHPTYEQNVVFHSSTDEPIVMSKEPVQIIVDLKLLSVPTKKIVFQPSLLINREQVEMNDLIILPGTKPSVLYQGCYYPFEQLVTRNHLHGLEQLTKFSIPEPLFGSFIEYSLPVMKKFAHVINEQILDGIPTLPHVDQMKADSKIFYLNGELEVQLDFVYGSIKVPAFIKRVQYDNIMQFISSEGVLSRNIAVEEQVKGELFSGFIKDSISGTYKTRNQRKIIEFMTEVIPNYNDVVTFDCPKNLLEQFVYDKSKFKMCIKTSETSGKYAIDLSIDGDLQGFKISDLWDCINSDKPYISFSQKSSENKQSEILVLNLSKLAPLIQFLDDLGIITLTNGEHLSEIWTLSNIFPERIEGLPIDITWGEDLKKLHDQITGVIPFSASPIPQNMNAELRPYQKSGVEWIEKLRTMHLSGILADDMGLGKTLQALCAITQVSKQYPGMPTLVVCPTSLLYNWKEEINRFNPELRCIVVDGVPHQRKKRFNEIDNADVVVTSYSLLQKDVEKYNKRNFVYAILDEAQHIKNRTTRNAKSCKKINAKHRLILTGTPVENSLDELWSLFDYLMPGFLTSFDRFSERYLKGTASTVAQRKRQEYKRNSLQHLKKKVSPFIMRRMKADVLDDLPPISQIVYHTSLTDCQRDLYNTYVDNARKELTELVEREGFEKVQIHILATLTRLKQICCHPAIFAKESAEFNDSAKYEMFLDMVDSLIESKHRAVVFSQYTRMLNIMKEDLKRKGIRFCYLDGSTKNRIDVVNEFNKDDTIPVFLVSLKAGGTGLNLVGADTVVHYDMWWNPAVESQATDRVYRIGQKKAVSSYKLVTLDTIEEKIIKMQERKKGLVKSVITSDDDVLKKLTWEEVLDLLQSSGDTSN